MTLKQKSVNNDLLSLPTFPFQVFSALSNQSTELSQNFNEIFTEFKNSDKELACASFWEKCS